MRNHNVDVAELESALYAGDLKEQWQIGTLDEKELYSLPSR
jgi:hypothetical protein